MAPPPLWGDPDIIRERLAKGATDLVFDRDRMVIPALSVSHYRSFFERSSGQASALIAALSASDPARLAVFRKEFEGHCSGLLFGQSCWSGLPAALVRRKYSPGVRGQ